MNVPCSCFALLVAGALALGICTSVKSAPPPDLQTVQHVELSRYMGRWYVISNVPYFFEKGKVASSDNYALRPDGRMDNNFLFRRASFDSPEKEWKGVAWVTNSATNAEWKVRLFWPFTSTYLVLELDPDYRWAVVSTGDGSLYWVLARERALPDDVYRGILERISKRGLEAGKLVKVPQPAG
jgi:apolipoprotein D and lipocalin family protein